jgi:hypothetical protein
LVAALETVLKLIDTLEKSQVGPYEVDQPLLFEQKI